MENLQKVSHESRDITQLTPRLLHAKRLAKAEITQDIKDEMVSPASHVQRPGPTPLPLANLTRDELAPAVDVVVDKGLAGAEGLVGKGIVHDAPLAGVDGLVDGVPRRHGVDAARVRPVVLCLFHIGLVAEDGPEGGGGVDEDAVGSDAEAGACVTLC